MKQLETWFKSLNTLVKSSVKWSTLTLCWPVGVTSSDLNSSIILLKNFQRPKRQSKCDTRGIVAPAAQRSIYAPAHSSNLLAEFLEEIRKERGNTKNKTFKRKNQKKKKNIPASVGLVSGCAATCRALSPILVSLADQVSGTLLCFTRLLAASGDKQPLDV